MSFLVREITKDDYFFYIYTLSKKNDFCNKSDLFCTKKRFHTLKCSFNFFENVKERGSVLN